MSDVPSVDGADIATQEQLEAANAERVAVLASYRYPEDILNVVATQVRVEAIVSILPPPLAAQLERTYERSLGAVLDGIIANVEQQIEEAKKPRLVTP